MRHGLIAAGLAAIAAAALLATGGRAHGASLELDYSCSATDRQFIKVAEPAKEVVREANDAALRVARLRPHDPSLQETKLMMRAMFEEYGRAVSAQAAGKPAGRHMYRAYQRANYIYDIVVDAQPALRKLGCDVSGLL